MSFIPVCSPLLLGNELKYVENAVKTGWISSSGTYVEDFEKAFADYCGVKYGIAVCNGTVALHLALVALGIGKGDEVIIPNFTMIASAFAVCYTGATPVFVDADDFTWNISCENVERAISSKTKAIMAVHLFGNPCQMKELKRISAKYRIKIIEDAAQGHGALYDGERVGALSDIAAFSFFANKNLTTGEGGVVVTNDEELAERCRYFKNLCFPINAPRSYLHEDIGFNYRMSNLHAALGLAQVERADEYKKLRQRNGLLYRELLSGIPGISLQQVTEGAESVFWMNGVRLVDSLEHQRTNLINYLMDNGIDTRVFFVGMHRQPALASVGKSCFCKYSVTDSLADNGFYLPSGSGLSVKEIEFVCEKIRNFKGL